MEQINALIGVWNGYKKEKIKPSSKQEIERFTAHMKAIK